MLDTETKRRIDTCRDILVGKVPDPKSQVEQITIALIYKFMDDMDREAEELGGSRKFFADEFAKFGWEQLMRPGVGGHEMLALYSEAIQRMNENTGIPELFRDIFKNAYLPYRDPETLRAFLKEINGFTYDHSERLGDAFEYLLSVLGSQGDAGQFRTPRHIIDFMVEIINPQKSEAILDPACGTAGFLISAWKHILKQNTDKKLTPDEKRKLIANIKGYDISPDMVRLSLVNLYLHGFTDPHIYEYDTLTSEDRWNETADVILANPPFMSPKGGIKPHKRFSIQAKRSEVLFVDYMAEHLTPKGRAAIIVPEGIIFQSQTAYTTLRKMLVENSLVAVISLPAGCFNPYSGVKTSILILDKSLAKKAKTIAFFKVENDGFGLGAQRRKIEKNDLPQAQAELATYLQALRSSQPTDELQLSYGLIVPKERIVTNGNYSLNGERYREESVRASNFPTVPLGDVCELIGGSTPSKKNKAYWTNGSVKWISSKHIDERGNIKNYELISQSAVEESSTRVAPKKSTIIITRVSVGKFAFADEEHAINQDLTALVSKDIERLSPEFIRIIAHHIATLVERNAEGIGVRGVTRKFLSKLLIPVPPPEVQKEIVAEIEDYQKVIDGARAVLDNYRPQIPVHSDWPMVELSELIDSLESGVSVNSTNKPISEGEIGILKTSCVTSGTFDPDEHKTVLAEERERVKCHPKKNSIIISRMNTEKLVGANAYVSEDYEHLFLPDRLWQTVISRTDINVQYLQTVLASDTYRQRISAICGGTSGSMKNISKGQFLQLDIPLPLLATQQAIVAEIEAEKALVAANRELIVRFEKKIQTTLTRIWGE